MAIKACALTDWQISCFRCAIGAAVMWLLLPQARRRWTWPVLAVGAAYAATMVLYALANKATTAANTIFLQSTAPLYILLLAPFLLGEHNRRRDILVMVGMAGGLCFFFLDESAASTTAPAPLTGNLMAAGAGVSWALTIMGLRWLESRPNAPGERPRAAAPVAVVAGNLIAALVCLPFAFPVAGGSPIDWLWVVYLGAFQIAVAYVLLTTAMGRVRALEASLLLLVEPVFNPIWTFLALGEVPGPLAIVGCGVILLTMVVKSIGDAAGSRASRLRGTQLRETQSS